jgi:hypothetical protein
LMKAQVKIVNSGQKGKNGQDAENRETHFGAGAGLFRGLRRKTPLSWDARADTMREPTPVGLPDVALDPDAVVFTSEHCVVSGTDAEFDSSRRPPRKGVLESRWWPAPPRSSRREWPAPEVGERLRDYGKADTSASPLR